MSHELGKKSKKYSRKHPFSDSFEEVLQGSFEKRHGFLRRFSNENVRSWPDSAAKPVPSSSKKKFGGFSSYEDIFTLLLGVAYSVNKSESSSSSEVRNYDHHRWETNKQIRETNTPCVPFDVFLFYHWERCEKVDHVRDRGLKECVANRFSPRPYFAGLFQALQAPCGVASKS